MHDAWAPYDIYTAAGHQLCCAHARRELQAITDLAAEGQWCWATQATDALTAMENWSVRRSARAASTARHHSRTARCTAARVQRHGTITAASPSQLSDGGCAVVVMSKDRAAQLGLPSRSYPGVDARPRPFRRTGQRQRRRHRPRPPGRHEWCPARPDPRSGTPPPRRGTGVPEHRGGGPADALIIRVPGK